MRAPEAGACPGAALLHEVQPEDGQNIAEACIALAATRVQTLHAEQPQASIAVLVRWKKTPVKAVQSALALLQGTRAFIAGVALTQMDLKAQSRYGYGDSYYYYANYRKYYAD